jgi:hypothetical protein
MKFLSDMEEPKLVTSKILKDEANLVIPYTLKVLPSLTNDLIDRPEENMTKSKTLMDEPILDVP